MKIAVCIKHVPDGRVRLDAASKRIDRTGPCELNDVDRYAVEEALRLQEAGGAEVVVVSMGPEAASDTLRSALALGADRAVHISDAGAAGSDLVATGKVLAAALRRESPDLVLFGQQSSEGGGSVLWAAVAERLGLAMVSQAARLELTGSTAQVTRQTEFGDDTIAVTLPAVIAVSDSINVPRYVSLKGKMGAKKKPLETLSLADLGLGAADAGDAGSRTTVLSMGDPPARVDAVKIDDDGTAAAAIVDYLTKKQLV